MSTIIQPVMSDVADLFWWKATFNFTSNVPNATGQSGTAQIKLDSKDYFVLVAWRGVSSYDPACQLRALVGASPGAAATGIYPAAVPNNFEAQVRKNNREWLMEAPMPQAALCSTGYRAGAAVPWPIIYSPSTMFNYYVYCTAETMFTTVAGVARPCRVDFGMFGYNVPASQYALFMQSWPELYGRAMRSLSSLQPPSIAPR